MISRQQAISLIGEHVQNKNIVKHMYAVEAMMEGLYDYFKNTGRSFEGTKEEWELAGLLHDGDYCPDVPENMQGIQITIWAKEKGLDVPENVSHAMASHNRDNTKVEPASLMDFGLFIGDSLTGLIVATALVLPSKKLSDVKVDSVLKKFRQKAFASGTRRDDISLCEEKLNLSLKDFIEICLKSMQAISEDLGL